MKYFYLKQLVAVCATFGFTTFAQAEIFQLAPGDEIELSVFARPDLSRTYRIRTDGTISVHIVGAITAHNRSPAELEAEIEARLIDTFDEPTSATLEVANWRPVIVSGDIESPGSIEFRPGTDVRMAIALAGGILRGAALEDQDTGARMSVQAEVGRAELFQARLAALYVERDRLNTQLADIGSLQTPLQPLEVVAKLVGGDAAVALAKTQDDLRNAGQKELELTGLAQAKQRELALREAEALAERHQIVNNQLELTLTELNAQEDLLRRGLARASSLFSLRVNAGQLRADALEALGLEAAARQKLEQAEAGPELAVASRKIDITRSLSGLETEILEVETQLEQSRKFAVTFGGGGLLSNSTATSEVYEVFRRVDGMVQQLTAAPDMQLHPGDILSVTLQTEN